MQSPLAGFVTACYLLAWPENLHQTQKGTGEHMIRLLLKDLVVARIAAVDADVLYCPQPTLACACRVEGFLAPKMHAQQVEAVFMVLPVALLAAGGAVARDYLRVNRGEAPDPA